MLSSFNGSERTKNLLIQCLEAHRDGEMDFHPLIAELPVTDPPLTNCKDEELEALLQVALQLPFGLLDLASYIGLFAGLVLVSSERDEKAESEAIDALVLSCSVAFRLEGTFRHLLTAYWPEASKKS